MKSILVILLFVLNSNVFADEFEHQVEGFGLSLDQFLENCTEIHIDDVTIDYELVQDPFHKTELYKKARLQLRHDIPGSGEMLDEDFFKGANNIFENPTDRSCEDIAAGLLSNKVTSSAYACGPTDQCGYAYKLMTIFENDYYLMTLKLYQAN